MRETETVPRRSNHVVNPVLLVLLLCADVAFLALHVFSKLSPSPNALLFLQTDGGYPEAFQYIKEYWISIVLFAVCWRSREGVYGAWTLLFAYLLCDDALRIHERAGLVIASAWEYVPAFRLRAQDFGELTVSGALGSAFLVLITYFYLGSSSNAKNDSKDLALLLAALVFFGIFVDMLNIAVVIRGFTIIEEAGEMATMSVITGYAVNLLDRQSHPPGALWQSTRAALTGRSKARYTEPIDGKPAEPPRRH